MRKWAIRAVLGALILTLILSQRGTAREVGAALQQVSPLVLGASVAFYWLGQILCAWKWQQLLRARGVEVSLSTCCRLYGAGMFGNLWLPTNIGGDALRASLLHRAAEVSLADGAASIVVERLTGFAALLFLATLGLLFRGWLAPLLSLSGLVPAGSAASACAKRRRWRSCGPIFRLWWREKSWRGRCCGRRRCGFPVCLARCFCGEEKGNESLSSENRR